MSQENTVCKNWTFQSHWGRGASVSLEIEIIGNIPVITRLPIEWSSSGALVLEESLAPPRVEVLGQARFTTLSLLIIRQ